MKSYSTLLYYSFEIDHGIRASDGSIYPLLFRQLQSTLPFASYIFIHTKPIKKNIGINSDDVIEDIDQTHQPLYSTQIHSHHHNNNVNHNRHHPNLSSRDPHHLHLHRSIPLPRGPVTASKNFYNPPPNGSKPFNYVEIPPPQPPPTQLLQPLNPHPPKRHPHPRIPTQPLHQRLRRPPPSQTPKSSPQTNPSSNTTTPKSTTASKTPSPPPLAPQPTSSPSTTPSSARPPPSPAPTSTKPPPAPQPACSTTSPPTKRPPSYKAACAHSTSDAR